MSTSKRKKENVDCHGGICGLEACKGHTYEIHYAHTSDTVSIWTDGNLEMVQGDLGWQAILDIQADYDLENIKYWTNPSLKMIAGALQNILKILTHPKFIQQVRQQRPEELANIHKSLEEIAGEFRDQHNALSEVFRMIDEIQKREERKKGL